MLPKGTHAARRRGENSSILLLFGACTVLELYWTSVFCGGCGVRNVLLVWCLLFI